mmetsp:Transcript_5643/g.8392  ORF Transcript_5643/g.8392 Transcript_5643/m.8392 type:complete len:153 (-) Transcript_5643:1347-1805(-)
MNGITADELRGMMTEIINAALTPVIARLDRIDLRLEQIDTRLRIMSTKHQNSLAGSDDQLVMVPNQQGEVPLEFPTSIRTFLVSGDEMLPNGQHNNWNKQKSRALLVFYGEDPDNESDVDDENSSRSRARRLRLAKKIGVSRTQLNFAQLVL